MPYVIMEAGATHTGYESCKRIIKACADAGADAVKFQSVYADDLTWPDDASEVGFTSPTGKHKESVREALKRRELPIEQWVELIRYAHECGIEFITTPSSASDAWELMDAGAIGVKIGKGDQNHFSMIEEIAIHTYPHISCFPEDDDPVPMIFLDGRERMSDISTAMELIPSGVETIIMHCPSGYPTEAPHLTAIPVIRQAFPNVPVGYADHSLGSSMCCAAVALGANYIEKTVSENPTTEHAEHYMSLGLDEIQPFVKLMREMEAAMGDPAIIFSSRVNKEARRGIYAGRDMEAGHVITLDDLVFKRPEYEWSADMYERLVGQEVAEDMKAGEKFGAVI